MYHILIVDDNDNNRFSLLALLKSDDITLYEAANGTEALAAIIEHPIDLIILDVQLPDYNGFELVQMIKNRKSTQSIPIILATAVFKAQVFMEQGFEAGAVDYVIKPINSQILLSKIRLYKSMHEEKTIGLKLLEENEALLMGAERGKAVAEEKFKLLADSIPVFVKVIGQNQGYSNETTTGEVAIIAACLQQDVMDDLCEKLKGAPEKMVFKDFIDEHNNHIHVRAIETGDGGEIMVIAEINAIKYEFCYNTR